jgi:hypothetical protein
MRGAPANPFSTRHHRPGAVPFLASSGGPMSVAPLLEAWEAAGGQGEILGPHGTGKSTLLHWLGAEAEARGRSTVRVELRDGARRLPRGWDAAGLGRGVLVLVDGAEQLAGWRFRLLRMDCARRGWGLLVTAHRPLGMPTLYRTHVDVALARRVVGAVLARSPQLPALVAEHEVDVALQQCGGNLREALFRLYDLYELRWREAGRALSGPGSQMVR